MYSSLLGDSEVEGLSGWESLVFFFPQMKAPGAWSPDYLDAKQVDPTPDLGRMLCRPPTQLAGSWNLLQLRDLLPISQWGAGAQGWDVSVGVQVPGAPSGCTVTSQDFGPHFSPMLSQPV